MAKFDLDKIKGFVNKDRENVLEDADGQGVHVGSGLLNNVSKLQTVKEMEKRHIRINQIKKSDKNRYSISKIKELAESIQDVGLLNDPIVKLLDDGFYSIVAGERRYTACQYLISTGKWDSDRSIRCSIFDPDFIDLNLSDEDKEEYVRLTENAEQRDKTDGDRIIQMRGLKQIYEKLRANGELRGEKTKDLLAKDMQESRTTISNMIKVENRGADEIIDAILEDKISLRGAVAAVDMPVDEQREFVQGLKPDKLATQKDVETYQAKKKLQEKKTSETSEEKTGGYDLNKKVFLKDARALLADFGDETVVLDEVAYAQYQKHMNAIKNLLKRISKA